MNGELARVVRVIDSHDSELQKPLQSDLGGVWMAPGQHLAVVERLAAPAEPQMPIVKVTISNGRVFDAWMYAPGLPDGEHDLFCAPCDPRGSWQPSMFADAAPAEPVVTVRDVLQLADDSLHDLHAQMDPDDFHDERVQIETARHFIAQAMSAHPAQQHVAAPAGPLAWRDVIAERRRQISAEGWTPEHDDEHRDSELAAAGACYAFAATLDKHALAAHAAAQGFLRHGVASAFALMWPRGWGPMKFKEPRSNLVRAAALLLAEIERLDRAAAKEAPNA